MNFSQLTTTLDLLLNEDSKQLNNMLKELSDLNDFLGSLSKIERGIITKKIKLFAESDSKVITYDSKNDKYTPEYLKMDMVHCDFTGVGYEWDGPHYALIWDVNPKLDSIMVIPTTSQTRKKEIPSIIPVGSISGFKKSTTLLVSDMTRVSRKRLNPVFYNHPKKGKIPVRLPMPWMPRIREAIAVTYTNEITFEEFIINNCGSDMVSNLKVLKDWRFRPVKAKYNPTTQLLSLRLWNSDEIISFELIGPKKPVTKGFKEKLIKNLFSTDLDIKAKAELLYADLY